jgi:hypothetical protein
MEENTMTKTVIVHLINEDPVLAEIERMPEPCDTNILIFYPRRVDGKPVHYLRDEATAVIYPMQRVSSIEVMAEERGAEEEITFYRE